MHPAPYARTHLHRSTENAREMTLIGKAACKCDVEQSQSRIHQQLSRPLHPTLEQIAMGRDADGLPKGASEMTHG